MLFGGGCAEKPIERNLARKSSESWTECAKSSSSELAGDEDVEDGSEWEDSLKTNIKPFDSIATICVIPGIPVGMALIPVQLAQLLQSAQQNRSS